MEPRPPGESPDGTALPRNAERGDPVRAAPLSSSPPSSRDRYRLVS